jgi:hypothetical protein
MTEKVDIEERKFSLECEKAELEKIVKRSDAQRANNDSVMQLLAVVKYLNEVRDGKEQIVDEGFNKTTYTDASRELNPLEEDLANVCLKSLAKIVSEIGNAKPAMTENV